MRFLRRSLISTLGFVALALMPAALASPALDAAQPKPAQPSTSADGFKQTDCFVSGTKRRARCATLYVPLYHDEPDGEKIETQAVILPAKSGKPEADPLVLFAGGPGQAATELVPLISAALDSIWQDRDIVLIDQRGTGRSTPLDCKSLEDILSPEEIVPAVAACQSDMTVDTRAFTLVESVHDIALMLKALGYDTVNTYGVSYGTRTSAYFLKTYPEMVRSMMVDAIAPPDYSLMKTGPMAAETALTALFNDCSASADCNTRFPALRETTENFLALARSGGLRYQGVNPVTGEAVDVAIDEIAAVESIRSVLYALPQTRILPYAIDEAAKGNLAPLMNQSFTVQKTSKIYLGMMLSFLCGEDIDRTSQEAAARFSQGSFTGDTFYRHFDRMCPVWSYLPGSAYPAAMFEPWSGDVPVLVLNGQYDPITPPSGADHIASTMTNARVIIVPGAAHGTFGASCVPYLMKEFINSLDGQALDASCTARGARPPIILGPNAETTIGAHSD